jgi:hypothetical protein
MFHPNDLLSRGLHELHIPHKPLEHLQTYIYIIRVYIYTCAYIYMYINHGVLILESEFRHNEMGLPVALR